MFPSSKLGEGLVIKPARIAEINLSVKKIIVLATFDNIDIDIIKGHVCKSHILKGKIYYEI